MPKSLESHMRKALSLHVLALTLVLCAGAEDKLPAFSLHVTHVRTEYLADKPTTNDCTKMPCTTLIITVEAQSDRINFALECKQWIVISQPMLVGKCWSLEAG